MTIVPRCGRHSTLRSLQANGSKLSMKDLTVLVQIDPFRMDTPANHKLAHWLAETAATLGLRRREDPYTGSSLR